MHRPVLVLSITGDTADVLDAATRRTVPLARLGPDYTKLPVAPRRWAYLYPKPVPHPRLDRQEPERPPLPEREWGLEHATRRVVRQRPVEAITAPPVPTATEPPPKPAKPKRVRLRPVTVLPVGVADLDREQTDGMDVRLWRAIADEPDKTKVFSRARTPDVVAVRQRVWQRLRRSGLSYAEIGNMVGMDHSSIAYVTQGKPRTEYGPQLMAMRAEAEAAFPGLFVRPTFLPTRTRELIEARHRLWLAMYGLCGSYKEVGRACGVSHSTIHAACKAQGVESCIHRGQPSFRGVKPVSVGINGEKMLPC